MIIGITGSFGAGKGAVVEYLVQEKSFGHYSARSFITREIEKRGLPVNRDSMIIVANDLRQQHAPTHIIGSLHSEATVQGGDAVIESLRAVAEVALIQELGGVVLGIDADPTIRYERIVERNSATDQVSFEEWLEQERKESNPDDPTKQDIFGALKMSDYRIENNGTLEDLYMKVDEFLEKVRAS